MSLNRRDMIRTTAAGLGASCAGVAWNASLSTTAAAGAETALSQTGPQTSGKVRFCLNTSTVREAKIPLPELIDMTAQAGYDSIEPWLNEIDRHVENGGKLSDLRKQLEDRNLQLESVIGFPRWAVDSEQERKAGFAEARRGMEIMRELGGTRIAAPPVGIHAAEAPLVDLRSIAERYRALLELGVEQGVIPQLEIWGPARNLSKLAEAAFVAVAADHPQAAILPDIYHLYRGGSDFHGLRLLSAEAIQIFHVNDYPGTPERTQLTDADRVYPGAGVAPITEIVQMLKQIGFRGALSLELFNREYWKQDPALVLKTGLASMQQQFGSLIS